MDRVYLVFGIFLLICLPLSGQNSENGQDVEEARVEPLPGGFNRIMLGMDLQQVRSELDDDGNFLYRGEPDVSFLPSSRDALIECEGLHYINRASFQFFEDRLFTITLIFDHTAMGYYSMYSTLQEKYGEPVDLSPDRAIWENEEVRLSLERPVRLKYMDVKVLEKLLIESERTKSLERVDRERFLEQF